MIQFSSLRSARAGALALGLGSLIMLPACSDTPEGMPARESISVPRNKAEEGGAPATGAPADGKAAPGGAAARKIDI